MFAESVDVTSHKAQLILHAELIFEAGPSTCPLCGNAGSTGSYYEYDVVAGRLTFYPCPACAPQTKESHDTINTAH